MTQSLPLPLEDDYTDVLKKALYGMGLSISELAQRCRVSDAQVQAIFFESAEEPFPKDLIQKMAAVLNLDFQALLDLGTHAYQPKPLELPDGFLQFNTPYESFRVNAYLVWDPHTRDAAVFDTGADVTEILTEVSERNLQVRAIYVTHAHGDHIFDVDRLCEKTGAELWTPVHEEVEGAQVFEAGKEFHIGSLQVVSRSTCGHSVGGVSYVVTGLDRPLAICGDALFAGSMGRGGVSYEKAIATNLASLFSLSDDTLVAPGHGPLTTIEEQKKANPFFAHRWMSLESLPASV